MREILLGILASVFFAVTFILNRSMELAGGSWLWSSSLRFIFMVPFLFVIVLYRGNLKPLITEMTQRPLQWLWWSFVGFVLFYAPITYAASSGPGWLIAGTWQVTIVAGTLLVPLFYDQVETEKGLMRVRKKIPLGALGISAIILLGVALIQWQHASALSSKELWLGVVPVVIAAFAYPLGNRKMMELCAGRLDTFQRVLGMTIASLPVWLVIVVLGLIQAGVPAREQVIQSFVVAVSSGVVATILFFIATDRVRESPRRLASVEATQSAQVVFAILGEIWILSAPFPNGVAIAGIVIIILGMLAHSFYTKR